MNLHCKSVNPHCKSVNLQCERVNLQRESMNLRGESVNLQRKSGSLRGESAGLRGERVNLRAESCFFGMGGTKNLVAAAWGGRIMRGVSAFQVVVSREVPQVGGGRRSFLARRQGAKPHSCTE